jgi:polyvinyl alcohol dehydrogenase (cytochrome)
MRLRRLLLAIPAALCLIAAPPDGAALYKARCAACHDGAPQGRMPGRSELAAKTPEFIFDAMFHGAMTQQAAGLSQEEGRAVARYLTGKEFAASINTAAAGKCSAPAPQFSLADGDWNGWGIDPGNSHYQRHPGLSASDVAKLKLKWAFGFPNDARAWAQPTVAGGRIFAGSMSGNVYSLDARTGCIYWSFAATAGVRSAVIIGKLPNGKWAAYFGDQRATTYAVDVETGALLWKIKIDDHPVAGITGAPVLSNGRLYVPISSISEEAAAMNPNYPCCTFRGSVSALDAATGKLIWKTYTVPDPAKPYKTNSKGTQLYGPAGVAVWSAPTIDLKRKRLYASGGNSYTGVPINTSDSILAFDLETGRLLWASQVQPNDNFIIGCPNNPNCPEEAGPDFDFGTSTILKTLPDGKDILIAGQKSGVVYGLDPDDKGKILWQKRLGKGSALGGVEWGHAADDHLVYAAISDRLVRNDGAPGLYALDLATGEQKWFAPPADVPGMKGHSAAVSVIPGVVFSGALNGRFSAYSAENGAVLWNFDTNRKFDTVNGVDAKGGSIDGPGPTIAHGMVYVNSGYGLFGGVPGNVLLAFSIDGK